MDKTPLADVEPMVPLQRMVTFRLSRLHAKLNAQAARILKESGGISLSQWRIFVMIEALGKITPAEIVRRTEVDKGLVSRTIKGMIRDGLLRAESSESDQRSHLVDFTKKGLAVFERSRPSMRERQDILVNSLSHAELQLLFTAFDKLELAMEDVDAAL